MALTYFSNLITCHSFPYSLYYKHTFFSSSKVYISYPRIFSFSFVSLEQESPNFFRTGSYGKNIMLCSQEVTVSDSAIQLRPCGTKAATNNTEMNGEYYVSGPLKLSCGLRQCLSISAPER